MDNEIMLTKPTAPRKLIKPTRDQKEMGREELVTYTEEGGGESSGSGKPTPT
jgi:hypothetical protein